MMTHRTIKAFRPRDSMWRAATMNRELFYSSVDPTHLYEENGSNFAWPNLPPDVVTRL